MDGHPKKSPKVGVRESAHRNGDLRVGENGHAVNNGNGNGAGKSSAVARTTVVLPGVLNENWEAFALQKGLQKNDVLIQALTKFLVDAGFQPDKRPKLVVSW